MRISFLIASSVVALGTAALPGVASAACVVALAQASAIRGPQYGGASGTAGCGAYIDTNVSSGNTVTAIHVTPDYTHQSASADAYGGSGDTPTSAHAATSANLADASLHGYASSSGNAFSNSNSNWSETLTFTNTTDQNQYLTIGWLVEGAVQWSEGQSAQVISNFSISTRAQQGFQEGTLGYFHTNGSTYDVNGGYNAFGWYPGYRDPGPFADSYVAYDLGGQSRLMTAVFGIAPGTHTVDVTGFMNINSTFGSTLDYSSTGALKFGALADGVSFTSDSGVFRPGALVLPGQGGGAVPEPATWAMMILGFGVSGAMMRRRRATVALG